MNINKFYFEEYSRSISKLTLKSKKIFSEKALFLDRDGVLIEDVHHINSPDKVILCPNIINFLKGARKKGYDFIVITNQSSVSRSIISYAQYKEITGKFLSLLSEDLYPDFILSSFHLPNNENNLQDFNWRKPGTGMIDYAFNLKKYNKLKSFIIGDKLTDLKAGYDYGIREIIHVKSELHNDEISLVKSWSETNFIQLKQVIKLNPEILF